MKNYLLIACLAMLLSSCSTEEDFNQDNQDLVTETKDDATIASRSGTVTGQYGIYHDPDYKWAFVQNNIWSLDDGDYGADPQQYVWYNDINNWGVKAYTTTGKYSYSGVKSYPGLVYGRHYNNVSNNNNGFPKQIKNITSNLTAEWSMYVLNDGGSGSKYNSSFDIWFDPNQNQQSTNKYEIMIWTKRKGQWPINENNDINIPWKSNVWVWNAYYNVYKGSIGQQQVLTFVQLTGNNGSNNGTGYFNAPLKKFIDNAVGWGWMSDTNYLTSIQAGFEICTAGTGPADNQKANFVTNKFSLKI
ncbi:hypothetical protein [Flavobacterium sp. HNIBRBA15423]|uniref:hypothetical protein n=1 Tax=Flavobacterium sp. HNIBRBA15423 TaxID=3458683 RepID=UPI004044C6F4